MVTVEQVTLRFGAFELLKNVSFAINAGDRIGLVGNNGAGKSTLLKIIAGWQDPGEGRVVRESGLDIGYLPQEMKHQDGKSLKEEARTAFTEVLAIRQRVDELQQLMEQRDDHHSSAYLKLIAEWTQLTEKLSILGAETMEADLERTLSGLGFTREDLSRPTAHFSGGWRMRIELAKILLRRPGLILLDEPTNHLDIEAIQWLEEFLFRYPGAVMLVSHDRAFLDRVTNRTIELVLGKADDYAVSYSGFVEQKRLRKETQLAAFRNQQKMIEKTEEFIERFRYKATKAVQVQSRIKQLEKLERIEVEEEDSGFIHLRFPPAPHSGKMVVELKDVGKSYGPKQVLRQVSLQVQKGDKIAFVGRNGEGKTTLIRIIRGELTHTGTCRTGHQVVTGYYAQNQDELMNGNLTVLETLDHEAVGEVRTRLRDIMGAFLFSGEAVDKKVKILSGGERSRLAMMRLLLRPVNLLLMDEPTNHLDMRSKDILKEALKQFTGTLIVVSHDREFLDGLVDKVYEFREGGIREYLGGIYDFLEKKNLDSLRELERKGPQKKPAAQGESDNRRRWEEKKEYERELRKLKQQVNRREEEITSLEKELGQMDRVLSGEQASGQPQPDPSFYEQYQKKKTRLEHLMYEWSLLHDQLEEMEKENPA